MSTDIPRLAREVLSYERTQYEGRVPTAAEQLARYVEDTAAIVEAAVAYSAAEQTANELAAMNTSVTEFSIAVRAQGDAYRALMEKVRAYRAKGAT